MTRILVAIALLSTSSAAPALAGEAKPARKAEAKGAEMTPEMKAQMEKAEAAGKPGPGHAKLKALEGRWNAKSQAWMKPGDKAMDSKGVATFEWILGGRFLRQKFLGDWAGQKFEGLMHIGYDNLRRQYVTTWMDSMGTGLVYSTGQSDESSKTIRDEGTYSCPMTGETSKWFRSEWHIPGGDTATYRMFGRDDSGKEYKTMEIVYTRAK
jgi:hypothetical protein